MSDKTFSPFLNTGSKQMRRARHLVETHLQVLTKRARFVRIQGMFSKTVIVTLKDGTEVVLQFRYEPLDIGPFKCARQAMGALVPTIEILRDEELEAADFWPVLMSLIPGVPWLQCIDQWDPQLNVTVATSLGKALSHCFLQGSSKDAVDHSVLPRLQKLLHSSHNEIKPYLTFIKELVDDAHQLDVLPLFISHLDLNQMNIMVLESGELSGIVDWELSLPPTPFGMGCNRIHDLAGEYNNAVYSERPEYQQMERGFWKEIIGGASTTFKKVLEKNPEAIQTSVMIGTVLDVLDIGVKGQFNKAALAALPKFVTYRIPALRGDDPPYEI